MKSLKLPERANYIIDTLEENGFEAYAVGGAVRDGVMGEEPKDWDIATSALPNEIKALFKRTVDTGIEHGTVTVVFGKETYEVTTYRIDGEYTDNRRPDEVIFTTALNEDLLRRDFTMNAIAYNPKSGYKDPFGGVNDIKEKIIRGVGEPQKRFQEDALRILRAIRFAAQLGFEIEPRTFDAIKTEARLIENISKERINQELVKLLSSKYIEKADILWESGVMSRVLPDVSQDGKTKRLAAIPKDNTALRLAVFFEDLPPQRLKAAMKDLRFDNATLKRLTTMAENKNAPLPKTPYETRKLISKVGFQSACDVIELKGVYGEDIAEAKRLCDEVKQNGDCVSVSGLALSGEDLAALGVPKGKRMGEVLAFLLDKTLENPSLNTPERLAELVGDNF